MKKSLFLAASALIFLIGCSSSNDGGTPDPVDPTDDTPIVNEVDFWLTQSNQSVLLAKQTNPIAFGTSGNTNGFVDIDPSQTFQTVDGFGYTLTGGSVQVINMLSSAKKQELLQEIFGTDGIRVSYLRLSIGASDLNADPFTYDDMPTGETDETLANFSLSNDSAVIGLLNEILAINPNIKIIAAPWSAPVWMKDNGSFTGGSLQPQYYGAYANYFVKYIQGMADNGITITAVTPQNEPENPYNTPSLVMTYEQQRDFIKNNLGPAFQSNGLSTKIVIFDHNCDHPVYPISILNDATAKSFIDGSAFHLYAGEISAMSTVHNAHPDRNVYFTEQYTPSNGDFGGDLRWHVKNVVIGSMRNWSKATFEWNLANDSNYGPHTTGGCTTCKGAITINSSSSYQKNVAYYIIAHASKFVPAGSVRIGSTEIGTVSTAAFKTPENKIVLVAINSSDATSQAFNVRYNGEWFSTSLAAGSAATYVFNQ
ncbi:glycoside hydrolase family 30 beta sandwich domain-containing protein [Flavobacterium silvaticum]|uniref:Glucosylceramidase n=1 Tax=Flavobacterium silvaticum TaxID=1852020 RepID=A0A972JIM9_9FLAO|nr:glycoside hydrolase family 30 beta sandwich domain-containing protein [Flavobacterium silvaticum]NMH27387.1 glucosylceramidase [Flavobacterium silvaticum]